MNGICEKDMIEFLSGGRDDLLFSLADEKRRSVFGDEVYLRGIIEFSNVCNKDCQYCGLRSSNRGVKRYRMNPDAIVRAADLVAGEGLGTIVLQSGDDFSYSAEEIGKIVERIKLRHDVAVTLSLGDRSLDDYAHWRDCGADRCLLKVETGHVKLYERLRCGQSFKERLHRLEGLKRLGYEVGSGIIVGLPDMNVMDLLRDLLLLEQLDLDMIAVGPFVPTPDTPLANARQGDLELSLRVSALMRLLCPEANIPATSALDAVSHGARLQALKKGCNVVMPSFTPDQFKAAYAIYPGKNVSSIPVQVKLRALRQSLSDMGLVPSSSKGFSPRRQYVEQGTARRPAGDYACGTA
ncbi:[FeFe] hydrogenase H-cluster radical SAM maturase HydE [Salidesulfovibrio onnuriiensis]|uniref:[FeFe] hydrogenase H-cluster radical SAM maturase HydE n=1 Tax=Salidesulfovibrio onnuriiensis TaxID=2583823 RepID=UPI00164F4E5C|nr:[FeFe] hydrogenase H-cluster radical SAM maturase HydE [Salidesulfovibrio onnuriiensis]